MLDHEYRTYDGRVCERCGNPEHMHPTNPIRDLIGGRKLTESEKAELLIGTFPREFQWPEPTGNKSGEQ